MDETWERFEVFEDLASAEALAGRLRIDDVPARIEVASPIPGLNEGIWVLVPKRLAHRRGLFQHPRGKLARAGRQSGAPWPQRH